MGSRRAELTYYGINALPHRALDHPFCRERLALVWLVTELREYPGGAFAQGRWRGRWRERTEHHHVPLGTSRRRPMQASLVARPAAVIPGSCRSGARAPRGPTLR